MPNSLDRFDQWCLVSFYHNGALKNFLRNQKKTGNILLSILLGLLLLAVATRMYQVKKASADGRKLIWKISVMMIKHRPIFGTGFGDFEKHYNYYQANYFRGGKGLIKEKQQADHVNMAYNELLEHGVNGGIIGMFLLGAIFVSILITPCFKKLNEAQNVDVRQVYLAVYPGLVCISAMSICNFTLQAVPVMALFVIYLAILLKVSPVRGLYQIRIGFINFGLAFGLLIGGAYLLVNIILTANASFEAKKLVINQDSNPNKWNNLASKLTNYPSFWISYGDIFYRTGQYEMALAKYRIAQKISSEKNLYLHMAACYEKSGNISAAINCYTFLSGVQPVWLQPKYRLLKIYQKQGDTIKVVEQASAMLTISPKIKSGKSHYYQSYAKSVLSAYQPAIFRKVSTVPLLKFNN